MKELDFLNKFNNNLVDLNNELVNTKQDENYPNFFILGLPRSGTTLVNQLIFNCLDVACTNNLISKFWEAPLVGAYLSKIILANDKPNDFTSLYGKSNNISSPHEFSYFWHKLLNINLENIEPNKLKETINWQNIQSTLISINSILEKPVLYKPLELVGYFTDYFTEILKKSIYIYIYRNPKDVAFSLAKGRLDYYNDINKWFSSQPPNYKTLIYKPYWQQIAGQISGLLLFYKKSLKAIPKERVIILSYEDLCNDPQQLLDKLIKKSNDLFNYNLLQVNKPPNKFNISEPKNIDKQIQQKLIEGLKIYNLI